jgi:hypothetical protein
MRERVSVYLGGDGDGAVAECVSDVLQGDASVRQQAGGGVAQQAGVDVAQPGAIRNRVEGPTRVGRVEWRADPGGKDQILSVGLLGAGVSSFEVLPVTLGPECLDTCLGESQGALAGGCLRPDELHGLPGTAQARLHTERRRVSVKVDRFPGEACRLPRT